MKKYYVAYGSNLCLEQMNIRCKNAKVVGTTILNDYKLEFKGTCDLYSYLTITPCEGEKVPVAIYELGFFDERALDKYEGYPDLYKKEYISVNINGKEEIAMIYIMHPFFLNHYPSVDYLQICMQGYEDFSFDKNYLFDALRYSSKERIEVLKRTRNKELD